MCCKRRIVNEGVKFNHLENHWGHVFYYGLALIQKISKMLTFIYSKHKILYYKFTKKIDL